MLTNCSYPITSRAPVQEENAMFAAVNIDRMPGSGKRYSPRKHNFVPFFSRIRPFRPGGIWLAWPVGWTVGSSLSVVLYRTSIGCREEEKTDL